MTQKKVLVTEKIADVALETLRAKGYQVDVKLDLSPQALAEAIADYLTQFSCIERVDLIGYHRFGATKYDQIGMTYTVEGESMPAQQRQEILELFQAKGHNAQLGG